MDVVLTGAAWKVILLHKQCHNVCFQSNWTASPLVLNNIKEKKEKSRLSDSVKDDQVAGSTPTRLWLPWTESERGEAAMSAMCLVEELQHFPLESSD